VLIVEGQENLLAKNAKLYGTVIINAEKITKRIIGGNVVK
jgi:hypothetical protein